MQIRESIYYFIGLCIILGLVMYTTNPLSAQESVDSLHMQKSLLPITDSLFTAKDSTTTDSLFRENRDRILSDVPLTAIDSVASDSTASDSIPRNKHMFNDVISFTAKDTMHMSLPTKQAFFFGDAKIKYQKTELDAAYVALNMDEKQAFASGMATDSTGTMQGTPQFRDGGQEFKSQELKYNFETGKGFVKEIITQEGEGYIQGRLTKRMSDSVYCVKEGWYTTCDQHDHPHFYVRMSKAKMIKDKKVVTGFANLVIEDVHLPIAIPFGFFPISKKGSSGIIMPTYGEENMRGFNLKNGGYYWFISDHIDMSVTGDIYTNGSWAANLSSNYRKRYKFSGNIYFKMSKSHVSEKGLPDYTESSDWAFQWHHTQDGKANPYSTFSAQVDLSSANNNFFNGTSLNQIADQRKSSSISWSKKWPEKPFSLTAAFNHNQNSADSTISITFPNIKFSVSQLYPFRKKGKSGELKWWDNIGTSYSAEMKNNVNTHEKELVNTSPKKWKNGFKHSIPVSTNIPIVKDLSLNPSFNYEGALYLSSVRKKMEVVDSVARVRTDTIYGISYAHNYNLSASLAYSPTLYGMYMFKPESRVYAIRHVLRPSISFTYRPNLGVSRSKYTRQYERDGNMVEYNIYEGQMYNVSQTPEKSSGTIGIGITNNLEMKLRNYADTTGNEEFKKVKLLESFSINTGYDIFKDSLNWSNISFSARTAVLDGKIGIDLSGTLDPYLTTANNVRVNKYNGGLGRLTRLTLTTNMNFSSDNGANREKKNELVGGFYDQYMDFDVPWHFSITYSLEYNQSSSANSDPGASRAKWESSIRQNMNVNGDFSLTPKWKLGFSSGFDFDNMEVTATQFNISRDLHCWDMTFSCIPFGTHQSFNFQINVRSSLLQDLKLTKRDSWYDNIW